MQAIYMYYYTNPTLSVTESLITIVILNDLADRCICVLKEAQLKKYDSSFFIRPHRALVSFFRG
jgi:hypothetical protein